MSFKAFVWAWDQDVPNGDYHHVLLALANIAPGRMVHASVPYIAGQVRRSPRKVRSAIEWLRDAGIIAVTPRPGLVDAIRLNIPSDFRVYMPEEDDDLEVGLRGRPRKTPAPLAKPSQNPCTQGADEPIEPGEPRDVVIRTRDPFDAWWDVYPRHVAKEAARKAWTKVPAALAADKLDLAHLMERTSAYADHVVGKDPEHVAHPATWLNGKRWNDELPARSQTDGRTTNRPDRAADQHTARVEAMLSGGVEALNRRRRWTLGG